MPKEGNKEFSTNRKVYTEKDFKNPTEEMKKDFWWEHDYAEWQRANGQTVTFESGEELIKYLDSL